MGSLLLSCWLVKQWTRWHRFFAEFYWFSISIQTNLRSSRDTSGSPPQFMVPLFVGSPPYRSPMRQGGCLVAWVAGADSRACAVNENGPVASHDGSDAVDAVGYGLFQIKLVSECMCRLDGVGWQSICVQGFVLSLLVIRTDSRSKTEHIVIIQQRRIACSIGFCARRTWSHLMCSWRSEVHCCCRVSLQPKQS